MHSCWSKAGIVALLIVVLLGVGCNDVYRPIVTPVPLPGGDPGTTDYVAVLNSNPSGAQDVVTFINVSGDTNVGNRLVGPGAAWLAWDGARTSTVVPNTGLNTVSQVTYSSTAVTTASLYPGSQPTYTFSRNTSNAYVLNQGKNTQCPSSGSIGVLLSTNNSLQSNICVGPHPVYFTQTSDGSRLIILDDNLSEAWIFNLNTNAFEAKLPVGSNPVWALVSPDNNTAFVLNQGSNDITVIDIPNSAVRTASVPTNGSSPSFMAIDSRRLRLYVTNQASATVSSFDITGGNPVTLHAPVSMGSGTAPRALAVLPDGSAVFVANTATNFVTRMDANSFLTTPIPVSDSAGATVTWVAASLGGSKVYASFVEPTNINNGTTIIRTIDNGIGATLPAPRQDVASCDPTVSSTPCSTLRMRPTQVASRQ